METCKYCLGTGLASRDPSYQGLQVSCSVCGGTGKVQRRSRPPPSGQKCNVCGGTGRRHVYQIRGGFRYEACPECSGTGYR